MHYAHTYENKHTQRHAWQDRKSKRTRQKNNRGDGKGELNDSPEIPERDVTSDITGLPSGRKEWRGMTGL